MSTLHRSEPDHNAILVGVDGSVANQAAVDYGSDLAASLGAPLHLVAAVSGSGTLPSSTMPDEGGWNVLSNIANAQRAEHTDLDVQTRVLFGDPADCLLEAAKEATVTVVGKRGLGTFTRMLLGSISTALTERADGPVIVVPREWRASSRPDDAAVVVGVAVTETSERGLLEWAFTEAARTGSPLDVVHAIDLEPMLVWDPALGAATYREWAEGTATRLAERVEPLKAAFPGVSVRIIDKRGHAATELLDRALTARLLVVARHRRSGFGFGIGSTERAVLHYAEVPVAVIPPEG